MLIFSVSFQFYRMIPEGNPLGREQTEWLPFFLLHITRAMTETSLLPLNRFASLPLLAFFRPQHLLASVSICFLQPHPFQF